MRTNASRFFGTPGIARQHPGNERMEGEDRPGGMPGRSVVAQRRDIHNQTRPGPPVVDEQLGFAHLPGPTLGFEGVRARMGPAAV